MNRSDAIGHLALALHWLDRAMSSGDVAIKDHHEALVRGNIDDVLKYLENLRDLANKGETV